MKRLVAFLVLFIGCSVIWGCSSKQKQVSENPHYLFEADGTLVENDPVSGNKVIRKAKSAIGTPYVLGGSQPGGFDCSGLVKWAYNSVGVKLPRTAREQSVVGQTVKNVKDMRAGDIVAFRHPRRGYHTGIYLGEGKFVHSPRKRSSVRINSLDEPYFSSTLLSARRVSMDGGENLIAQAEQRLREYSAQRGRMVASAAKSQASASKNASKAKNGRISGKNDLRKYNQSSKLTAFKNSRKGSKLVAEKHTSKNQTTKISKTNGKASSKSIANNTKAAKDKKQQVATKKTSGKTISVAHQRKTTKTRGHNS